MFYPLLEKELEKYATGNRPSTVDRNFVIKVCGLVKEKATFVSDFWDLSSYLFIRPDKYDTDLMKKKWNEKSAPFFEMLITNFSQAATFKKENIDQIIKQTAAQAGIKPGEIMQLLRVLTSGRGSGVDLLGMLELLGKDEASARIRTGLNEFALSYQKN